MVSNSASLITGSEMGAREYCRTREFSKEDSDAVISKAKDLIEQASRDKSHDELALSVARYDYLFEKAQGGAEPDLRTSLRAQIARDRVTGTGLNEGADEIVRSFADVIARVTKPLETKLSHEKEDSDGD